MNDEELMLAAGRGDRDSFAILVERHHRAVVRFVQPFLGVADREAAEDLAQDVFLAAWKAAPSFRVRAKVLTCLLRITTNVCLNYQRGARLRRTISFRENDAADRSDAEAERPDAVAMTRERAGTITGAVASLPANQCAAIVLRHFHELSYAEIADVLDVSVSAVESLLFRARRVLSTSLASENEASPQVFPARSVE